MCLGLSRQSTLESTSLSSLSSCHRTKRRLANLKMVIAPGEKEGRQGGWERVGNDSAWLVTEDVVAGARAGRAISQLKTTQASPPINGRGVVESVYRRNIHTFSTILPFHRYSRTGKYLEPGTCIPP